MHWLKVAAYSLGQLRKTGRNEDRVKLVELYAKENGFWRTESYNPIYSDTLQLDNFQNDI